MDCFAIKPLIEIKPKHFTTKNQKHINYILLDYICRKYSIPIFRYRDECLKNHNNAEGELTDNTDIALWIEKLGYEYSEKEDERRQNMFEVKENLEKELIRQSSDFLNQYSIRTPEFSWMYLAPALVFLWTLFKIISIF